MFTPLTYLNCLSQEFYTQTCQKHAGTIFYSQPPNYPSSLGGPHYTSKYPSQGHGPSSLRVQTKFTPHYPSHQSLPLSALSHQKPGSTTTSDSQHDYRIVNYLHFLKILQYSILCPYVGMGAALTHNRNFLELIKPLQSIYCPNKHQNDNSSDYL